MDKQELLRRIVETLRGELRVIDEAAQMANEEAVQIDDLTESQREPRAVENAYLVDGQSRLAAEMRESIAAYEALPLRDFSAGEPIALSALVEVESGGDRATYFFGPKAGGMEVSCDDRTVFVLSPQSPLARRLLGRNQGDSVAVDEPARAKTMTITAVR